MISDECLKQYAKVLEIEIDAKEREISEFENIKKGDQIIKN